MNLPLSENEVPAAVAADLEITLPGGVPLQLRRIPRSSAEGFLMGSRGESWEEEPRHRVVIPHGFWLGTCPVTQEQYAAVAREVPELRERADPSDFKGASRPVENVDWHEANRFCDWLTRHVTAEELPDNGPWHFCLPTEAEWEHACRAETETDYHNGDGEAALAEVGWYDGNSGKTTHPVGEKPSNAFGLHDLHGNVWEWCHDAYERTAYRLRVDAEPDLGWELRRVDWQRGLDHIVTPKDDRDRDRVIRGGSGPLGLGVPLGVSRQVEAG